MSNKTTVRILNLQGGGVRGYMSATVLELFCVQAGIAADQLYNSFDIISGTSIGGMQALGYAYGKTPTEFTTLIWQNAADIFNYGDFAPHFVSRATYGLGVLMGVTGYEYLVAGQTIKSMYQSGGLQTVLTDTLGSGTSLSDIPGKVIITSWDVDETKPVFFSNITNTELSSFLTGASSNAVDVGLCTSAAPTYFPIHTFGGHKYSDGGIFQNNPVETALSVARRMYPNASRFCIVSIGTGLSQSPLVFDTDYTSAPYNVQFLNYLSNNVFIPGPQQAAQDLLALDSSNPYEEIFTYQFQYTFLPGQDSSLDNPDYTNLINLANYATNQYNSENEQKTIRKFIRHFNID